EMTAIDVRVIGEALEGRPRGASVLIAEDERGQRVGFIHLCEEQDYYGGACGHVGDVVVTPAARGRGAGRALLAAGARGGRAMGAGARLSDADVECIRGQREGEGLV